jgi:hypothetical protein
VCTGARHAAANDDVNRPGESVYLVATPGGAPPGAPGLLPPENRGDDTTVFSLDDRPYSLCDRISRRELMRIGGLNLLGLSPARSPGPAETRLAATRRSAGRRHRHLWLQGGPPQHETFDPAASPWKPGPFKLSRPTFPASVLRFLPHGSHRRQTSRSPTMSTDDHARHQRLLGSPENIPRAAPARSSPATGLTSVRWSRCSSRASACRRCRACGSPTSAAQRQRAARRQTAGFGRE